jgi:hypothetical protein
MIEHFTRVETFGAPNAHWLRAMVDPNDPQVCMFKPEMIKNIWSNTGHNEQGWSCA